MTAFAPVVDLLAPRNVTGYTLPELVELRSQLQTIHAAIAHFRDHVFCNKMPGQRGAKSATPASQRPPPVFHTPTEQELKDIAEEWKGIL
jgi:hypothetical protein